MKKHFQQWRSERYRRARERWSRPLNSLGLKARAWSSLLFSDHGFLRPVYWNKGEIAPGLWRGPQPNPFHLRRLVAQGLKTIINLRGPTEYGSYALAKQAAQRYGLTFIDLPLSSGAAPRKEQIHRLHELFQTVEKPALLHCKSGADRSGLAAVLYLILIERRPVEQALAHLSRRYGHIKVSRTGVLDAFFDRYIQDTKERPMDFLAWVDDVYDPEALNAAFERPTLTRTIVDFFIRRE